MSCEHEVLDLLKRARAKIEDKENWCQRAYARNKSGFCVAPWQSNACTFCAYGAIYSFREFNYDVRALAEDRLVCAVPPGEVSPATVNDVLGHQAVLDMYDKAIALLQGAD